MILLGLDPGDSRPIHGQIGDRVKFAVAAGALAPGELVPSIRELARQLVVNPNTVARAYRDLQAEGLLTPVRGTGLAVAEGAREKCLDARREHVRARLRGVLDEARRSELSPPEIEQIFREEWEASANTSNGAPAAASAGGQP
jgi:GntR family transcriptional regulator